MAGSVLMIGAAAVTAAGAPAVAGRPAAAASATIWVSPGDTLWGMAIAHAPRGVDPRVWIYHVEQINGLSGAALVAGQALRLPAGSR